MIRVVVWFWRAFVACATLVALVAATCPTADASWCAAELDDTGDGDGESESDPSEPDPSESESESDADESGKAFEVRAGAPPSCPTVVPWRWEHGPLAAVARAPLQHVGVLDAYGLTPHRPPAA